MPRSAPATLTDRQRRWFASVESGLESDTGRTLEAWALIARDCPETAHRKRLAWMKTQHGLGQNRASLVLSAAFPDAAPPEATRNKLWSDAAAAAILAAVEAAVAPLDGTVSAQRKSFTAFSRSVQYAAMRPDRRGGAVLGLAVVVEADQRLVPRGRESWSERLHTSLHLAGTDDVDASIAGLLRLAWEGAA